MDQLHACFPYPVISILKPILGLGTWINGNFGNLGSASSKLLTLACNMISNVALHLNLRLTRLHPCYRSPAVAYCLKIGPIFLLFMSNGGFNTPTNHRALKIVARVLKVGT